MTYRLEIDIAYNCRPKKGERRAKDGTGRMVKCQIIFGDDLADCLKEARVGRKSAEKIAPGYTEVIEVRGYDKAKYEIDPLKAVPEYRAPTV